MIDLHSHILPGLDDGAKDLDTARDMLRISCNEGTNYICATPHYIPYESEIDRLEYDKKWGTLNEIRAEDNSKITMVKGLEIYIHPDLPNLYKQKKIWGINDGKFILVELPMEQFPVYTADVFYELRLLGLYPILAHPERNLRIIKNHDLLYDLIEDGIYAQINSGSLLGNYGSEPKKTAMEFIKSNAVHFIGSDAHNTKSRPPKIAEAYSIFEKLNPSLCKNMVFYEESLLNNREFEKESIKRTKKKGFLSFFK